MMNNQALSGYIESFVTYYPKARKAEKIVGQTLRKTFIKEKIMKSLKWLILGILVVARASLVSGASITVSKETAPVTQKFHIGDTIDYDMFLENPSPDFPLVIEDVFDLPPNEFPGGTTTPLTTPSLPYSLAPNGQAGYRQDYTFQWVVADGPWIFIENGAKRVRNRIDASGFQDIPDNPDDASGSAQKTSMILFPCVDVTKTVEPTISKAGDDVVYTIVICNCGDTDLTVVEILDDVLGQLPPDCEVLAGGEYVGGELQPGECCTITFTYTIQPDDPDPLVNEVCVTAVDEVGGPAGTVTDCDTATVDLVQPNFEVTKVCLNGPVPFGALAEFRITITNTGDVALDLTTDEVAIPPFTLPAGGVRTEDVTHPVPAPGEEVCNIVTVTATLPVELGLDNVIGPKTSEDCCPTLPPVPCVEVDKTVEPGTSKVGDSVFYSFVITNCGDEDLVKDSITDTLLDDALFNGLCESIPVSGSCPMGPIEYVVQQGDLDPLVNIITVVYNGATSAQQVTDNDDAVVDLVQPEICITKTVDNPTPCYGDTVTYTICIDNCGNYPLENIVVTDPHLGGVLTGFPSTMDPEDSPFCVDFSYVVQVDGPCPLVNTAVVHADPLGPMTNDITDDDPAEICPQPCGGEGCTPGFWKNNAVKKGANAWDVYSPGDDFSTVFGIPEQVLRDKGKDVFSNPTLLQALNANGGGINALARHATAALLDSSSDCVDYPMSAGDIITAVQNAIAAGDDAIQALHSQLAEYNEAGCPVNQQGECNGD